MNKKGNGKTSKYNNKKVVADGLVWDSVQELEYYKFLVKLQDLKIINEIVIQPKVILQPTFWRAKKRYLSITYTPDFLVTFENGLKIYFDVKGMSTQAGELRRKIFAYQNEIPLVWVASSKKYSSSGWINWDSLQKIRRKNKKKKEEKNVECGR